LLKLFKSNEDHKHFNSIMSPSPNLIKKELKEL